MSDSQPATIVEKAAQRLRQQPGVASPDVTVLPEAPRPAEPTIEPASLRDEPEAPAPKLRDFAIDFRRLASFGVFSPDHGTNRTTEEFRLVKRTVLANVARGQSSDLRNPNLIMVTSSRQGEGKSFVAFNLALSLASETDKTVLLIDADSSRSSVVRMLGIDAEHGFLDLLERDDISVADVILKSESGRLSIIPAGDPHVLSTELFAGARAGAVLQEISLRYSDRIIVVDAPPVLATSEPTALALHAGQIVFVVDAQKTTKSAINEALGLIDICPNIGFVLNKAEFQFGAARFGSYYGYYGYNEKPSRRQLNRRYR